MDPLRLVASILMAIAALWVTIMNWYIVFSYCFTRKHVSWVPLVGGLLGCGATLAYPGGRLASYWWMPLLADWGCAPGLSFTAVCFLLKGGAVLRR
jgi:hypothetical protein